jgi:hypothetical protein
MWYLLLTLYLPLQDKELYVRFDDFRSLAPCIQAKIKLMEHQADLMEKSGNKSFITKIECREVDQASTSPNKGEQNG